MCTYEEKRGMRKLWPDNGSSADSSGDSDSDPFAIDAQRQEVNQLILSADCPME